MKRIILLAIVLSFLVPAIAIAGEFDDPFSYFYHEAGPEDVITAMVFLVETYDARAVSSAMAESGFTRAQRHEEVIIGLKDIARRTQTPILSLLDSFGSDVAKVRPFWIGNVIEVHAKKHVFDVLAQRDDVARIRAIPEIALIEPVAESPSTDEPKGIEGGISSSRAPELWAMGFTGATALACDMDTGADGDHPAFGDRWRGLDEGVTVAETWFDPVTSTTFPFDAGSHGTHTLGTIVGDDGGSNQIGMAPGAKWIAAGVIDRVSIPTTYSDAYASFEWAADPDGDPETTDDVPDVISNSWGLQPSWSSHGVDECDDYLWPAIDAAEAAGVAVIFAAGNEQYMGASSLRVPADRNATLVTVFAVGALNQDNTTIASFSSLGPSTCTGTNTFKPEVSAVGVDVRSSVPNDSYGNKSGTSMAAPHVSGAVLLLRDAFPEATVDDLKLAIYNSADDLGSAGEDNTFGMGALDVVDAFNWLCANGYGDADEDGYTSEVCGGDDCDDTNGDINPGETEACNGVDDNCVDGVDEGGDALCNDGLWCNGEETCDGVNECQAGTNPCPDDGVFCNGDETCDEGNDQCTNTGDPCVDDGLFCNGTESCNEANDDCDHSGDPCPGDGLWCNGTEYCDEENKECTHTSSPEETCPDDGLFCNGTETCDEENHECAHSGDPCETGESCNEEADSCDLLDDDDDAADDDSADDDAGDDDDDDDDDDDGCGGSCG